MDAGPWPTGHNVRLPLLPFNLPCCPSPTDQPKRGGGWCGQRWHRLCRRCARECSLLRKHCNGWRLEGAGAGEQLGCQGTWHRLPNCLPKACAPPSPPLAGLRFLQRPRRCVLRRRRRRARHARQRHHRGRGQQRPRRRGALGGGGQPGMHLPRAVWWEAVHAVGCHAVLSAMPGVPSHCCAWVHACMQGVCWKANIISAKFLGP